MKGTCIMCRAQAAYGLRAAARVEDDDVELSFARAVRLDGEARGRADRVAHRLEACTQRTRASAHCSSGDCASNIRIPEHPNARTSGHSNPNHEDYYLTIIAVLTRSRHERCRVEKSAQVVHSLIGMAVAH